MTILVPCNAQVRKDANRANDYVDVVLVMAWDEKELERYRAAVNHLSISD